ncbi:MAG: hypothetical protein Ct9H300mP1_35440 [Planctomycetaceae bacterium]|nr:MAG: hypothetical protein Ct9H300mP1_35440 [Planctomycetaceae bacterium]
MATVTGVLAGWLTDMGYERYLLAVSMLFLASGVGLMLGMPSPGWALVTARCWVFRGASFARQGQPSGSTIMAGQTRARFGASPWLRPLWLPRGSVAVGGQLGLDRQLQDRVDHLCDPADRGRRRGCDGPTPGVITA